MFEPETYKNSHGFRTEAMLLSKQNVDALAEWCDGFQVRTYDPTDSADEEGQVGVNFFGVTGPDRVSEGQWLIKTGHGVDGPIFKVMSQSAFHAEYERV